jgi:hypothetical protein
VLNSLTTLDNVKAWANVSSSNDDLLLTRLIGSASRGILSYLQRPTLFQNVFSDVYDGVGNSRQILRHWPVLSVASVTVDYQTIVQYQVPQQPTPYYTQYGCGWVLEPWDGYPPGRPQAVDLRGFRFCRGNSNVQIVYTAGFVVQNEAQTVPASSVYSVAVNAPNGNWAVDQGVTYASSGTALTPVASAPAQGQYSVAAGLYTFNAADASQAVLISYSYIPSDIEDACITLVGERYSYKNRIGTVSKSLGGQETVSYSQKDMPDFIKTTLRPYRRVILV